MKKYVLLGELLTDYRKFTNTSQNDFAAELNVDVRTVARWEKDHSLIKSEKEELLVETTFIPFQVIRNLNALVTIPTYYDFRLRKYSLSALSREFPHMDWVKVKRDQKTNTIRPIELKSDYENIFRFRDFRQKRCSKTDNSLIKRAVELLPDLNFILFDQAGYYSGHMVTFPLSHATYNKIKTQEIGEDDLNIKDLVGHNQSEDIVFHSFDSTVDCNDNVYFLIGRILRFFEDRKDTNPLYSSITLRTDDTEAFNQLNGTIIWEKPSRFNNIT